MKWTELIGRILLAQLFLIAGIHKITAYAGTQGYMEAMGVPGMLLPLVILLEVGGGLMLVLGWKARWTAAAMGVFSLTSAAIFHHNLADQMQMIMFMKNLSIAGGMFILAVHGAGVLSLDERNRA
ncbi:MAG: DoxX family protein [Zetaproteobacteria bacterium]|nr:MAG: DoxX family protein [Zetaproteobacteria bacterium]